MMDQVDLGELIVETANQLADLHQSSNREYRERMRERVRASLAVIRENASSDEDARYLATLENALQQSEGLETLAGVLGVDLATNEPIQSAASPQKAS